MCVPDHPGEQIIHRAEVDGIDVIILGRRGRSVLKSMKRTASAGCTTRKANNSTAPMIAATWPVDLHAGKLAEPKH
jgi:nucleotide-binding universal stress UspA family protein